ncbi:hypothetical protein [Pseudomonas sp. R5(2019)]|uniref:hypothetical protein n=1 Tax=Pseudomonas sp. R5(2019) TaxID=2697566 RepID=UPI001411FE31|nr:hypothetical protein [Pseudomonas sp. R5(2019)]NBA98320.1 hypothetical protein [Pseudomonas sp. R5(2019)]
MHENTESRREANTVAEHFHDCRDGAFYRVSAPCGQNGFPRYRVIAAGVGFFHITEHATGHVRGFRRRHDEACALARNLEAAL